MNLNAAANPDWADRVHRELDSGSAPTTQLGQRRFAVAAGASLALGERLLTDTSLVRLLDQPDLPDPTREVIDAEPDGVPAAKRRGLFTIAVRDLTGELDTQQAATALSDLADAVLRRAHRSASELPEADDAALGVLALGKLGGQELNYVSDVDVLFVHDGDQAAAVRMAQHVLEQGGLSYEMDAGLRPEGRSGALSRTVESHVTYHERWGRTWELQALLKLRAVAGPRRVTGDLTTRLAPLVWPEAHGADAVAEIQSMKTRWRHPRPSDVTVTAN